MSPSLENGVTRAGMTPFGTNFLAITQHLHALVGPAVCIYVSASMALAMPEYIVALTTCPAEEVERIALDLVESKSCACANIIPSVNSIYHWKGEVESAKEAIILLKTIKSHEEKLWKLLARIHPYEVPEFIVLDIISGSSNYLKWISNSVES